MKITKSILAVQILFLCFFADLQLNAGGNTWLSGNPPGQLTEKIDKFGMCKLPVIYGKGRQPNIVQWIRTGEDPQNSLYLNNTITNNPILHVFDPDGNSIKGKMVNNENGFYVTYPGSKEGYHSIYLIEKFVLGDTLNVAVAKAELMSHSCRNGHNQALINVRPKLYTELIPVEIIRERSHGENYHPLIEPGDDVTYKVLIEGEAVEGGNVQMATHMGWIKKLKTDTEGKSTFQFIQDDNTNWQEVQKRKTYTYLLTFDHTIKREGIYNENPFNYIRYTSTFAGTYRPTVMLYSSYVWALAVLLISIIIISAGIFIYRKKNKIEFKEIVFNE